MSTSQTKTQTFTKEDVTKVIKNLTTELKMIASSTKASNESKVSDYGHDVEYLAQRGYLRMVDVTLMDGTKEVIAAQYEVREDSKDLVASKPSDAMWPRVTSPFLRIVLTYKATYSAEARAITSPKLRIEWSSSDADLSHPTLTSEKGHDLASNNYGLTRKDFK